MVCPITYLFYWTLNYSSVTTFEIVMPITGYYHTVSLRERNWIVIYMTHMTKIIMHKLRIMSVEKPLHTHSSISHCCQMSQRNKDKLISNANVTTKVFGAKRQKTQWHITLITIISLSISKLCASIIKLSTAINLHCESKKQATIILSITKPNVDCFSKFFTDRFTNKYATKPSLTIPPHLKRVAALSCETSVSEN